MQAIDVYMPDSARRALDSKSVHEWSRHIRPLATSSEYAGMLYSNARNVRLASDELYTGSGSPAALMRTAVGAERPLVQPGSVIDVLPAATDAFNAVLAKAFKDLDDDHSHGSSTSSSSSSSSPSSALVPLVHSEETLDSGVVKMACASLAPVRARRDGLAAELQRRGGRATGDFMRGANLPLAELEWLELTEDRACLVDAAPTRKAALVRVVGRRPAAAPMCNDCASLFAEWWWLRCPRAPRPESAAPDTIKSTGAKRGGAP